MISMPRHSITDKGSLDDGLGERRLFRDELPDAR